MRFCSSATASIFERELLDWTCVAEVIIQAIDKPNTINITDFVLPDFMISSPILLIESSVPWDRFRELSVCVWLQ